MGLSLLPEEEKLKSRLESISATVNSTPFKVGGLIITIHSVCSYQTG